MDQGSGRSFEELFAAAYGRLVGLLLPLAGTTPATDGDDLPVAGRLLAGRLVATQPAPCRPA